MQDEPGDDHEGEEEVERNGNRKVWNTEVDGDRVPDVAARSRGSADESHDTRRYINDVTPHFHDRIAENLNAHPERQGT